MDNQVFFEIPLKQLLSSAEDYKSRGWRLANLCASTVDDGIELLYSFVKDDLAENLSVLIAEGEVVPAVSPLYPSAFVFENETHDLFGVRIEGITLDYKGAFYSTSVPTPMNPASSEAAEYLEEAEVTVPADSTLADSSSTPSETRHAAEEKAPGKKKQASSKEKAPSEGEEKERG